MASYESVIGTLEAELTTVADVFGSLAPDQWRRPTLLVPVDPELPRWTVFRTPDIVRAVERSEHR